MGRGAVTEGVEEPAESDLGGVGVDPQDLEDLALNGGIVDPDRARTELDAVEDDVVGVGEGGLGAGAHLLDRFG